MGEGPVVILPPQVEKLKQFLNITSEYASVVYLECHQRWLTICALDPHGRADCRVRVHVPRAKGSWQVQTSLDALKDLGGEVWLVHPEKFKASSYRLKGHSGHISKTLNHYLQERLSVQHHVDLPNYNTVPDSSFQSNANSTIPKWVLKNICSRMPRHLTIHTRELANLAVELSTFGDFSTWRLRDHLQIRTENMYGQMQYDLSYRLHKRDHAEHKIIIHNKHLRCANLGGEWTNLFFSNGFLLLWSRSKDSMINVLALKSSCGPVVPVAEPARTSKRCAEASECPRPAKQSRVA